MVLSNFDSQIQSISGLWFSKRFEKRACRLSDIKLLQFILMIFIVGVFCFADYLFCRGTVTSPMLLSWSELLIDEYLFDSSMSESLLLKTVFENCIVPQGGHTQLTAPPINLLYCDGGISTHFM